MKKINHKICFSLILMISVLFSNAQNDELNLRERLYFGGNFGLQLGSVTMIDLSPLVGYKFTEKFSAGVGITYKYFNDSRHNPSISTNIYGGSIFSRYFILDNVFAHAEFENTNLETKFDVLNMHPNQDRFWIQSVFIGAGYIQRFNENSGAYILLLWNLNESSNSIYQNPVIRVGFTF